MTDLFTKRITMKVLKGTMTFDEGQRALSDPEAYKKQEAARSIMKNRADGAPWPGNYYWGGKVKTPRMVVTYCWAKVRNRAGYFIGWREVYDAKGKLETRDQFIARKTKWRLKELQKRKTAALIAKQSARSTVKKRS